MAEMSMNAAVHGAFRRDLDRLVSALEQFPAGDTTRAQQLGRAWGNLDAQLVRHHEGEHAIAWPALTSLGVPHEVIAAMDAEHDAMAAALVQARAAMATFARTAGRQDADAALAKVQGLREVTLAHLDHEERELEPIYHDQRDSPELKAMGRAFGRVSPTTGGQFFAWVLDGASADERAAISRDVPGPVLALVNGVFGRGYRRSIAPTWKS